MFVEIDYLDTTGMLKCAISELMYSLNVYLGNVRLKLLVEVFKLMCLLFNFIFQVKTSGTSPFQKFNIEIGM